jgi:hypothetical protein
MSLSAIFKTDNNKETNGFCVDYGPHATTGKPVKIYLAYAGKTNSKYQRAIRRLTKPVERLIQNESLPEEQSEAIYKEAFAESCIVGWEGVYKSDIESFDPEKVEDEPATCNKANILALFEALPHLYDDLVQKASKISNFKAEALEADAKN